MVSTARLSRVLRAALLRGSKTDPQRPLPTDPLTTDRVRRRPTKLSHLIEDVTCEDGLRLLPRPTARSKALPDDQLVPEEGVLHTGLLMVARVLLPLSPSSLLHLWVSNSLSGRRWQLNQVPAVRCPPYVVEVRTGYRVSARHGERRVAVQGRVAPCRVVVGLEVGECPLQIPPIPEEHLVQKFSPYRADQALYKGV